MRQCAKPFNKPTFCTNLSVSLKNSTIYRLDTLVLKKWVFLLSAWNILKIIAKQTELGNVCKTITWRGCVSFIHSFIPSFIHPFIHSSVCFPSLPAVIYSVELERQAAEYWVISAFLSRHSTPHESLQLKEKETKVVFVFMSLCL